MGEENKLIKINSFAELARQLKKVPKDYECKVALGHDCSAKVNCLTIYPKLKRVVIWGNYE